MRASRFFAIEPSSPLGLSSSASSSLIVFGSNRTISVTLSILSWIDLFLNATFSKMPRISPASGLWQDWHIWGTVGRAGWPAARPLARRPSARTVSVRIFMATFSFGEEGQRAADWRTWLAWPAFTSTQRRAKPPASTSSAGTTVWGMRWPSSASCRTMGSTMPANTIAPQKAGA